MKQLWTFRLRNRLFFIDLWVVVGLWDTAQKWVNRRFGNVWADERPSVGKAATYRLRESKTGCAFVSIIYLRRLERTNPFDISSLVHESLHVVWSLLDEYGCHDEETHCYLQEWIVESVLVAARDRR